MIPVMVLHTTESTSFDSTHRFFLGRPGIQPHVMIDPQTGQRHQYIPWNQPAKALRNLPGGVETNRRGGVIQIEIVGRAAEMGDKPIAWYRSLAELLAPICEATGVPRRFPVPFVAYPASYGLRAAQRLSGAAWLATSGIVGHQHVPENDHGDPGDLNRLIPLLQETTMPDRTTLVMDAQRWLNSWGAALRVDGDFGPATHRAFAAVLDNALAQIRQLKEDLTGGLADLNRAFRQLEQVQAEVARLAALDTVARQGPAVVGLIQAGRAELTRLEGELGRIGGS